MPKQPLMKIAKTPQLLKCLASTMHATSNQITSDPSIMSEVDVPSSCKSWDDVSVDGAWWDFDYEVSDLDLLDPYMFEQIGSAEWTSQFDDLWESWPSNLVHQFLFFICILAFCFEIKL